MPQRIRQGLAMVALLAATLGGGAMWFQRGGMAPAAESAISGLAASLGGPFSLVDQEGRRVTQASYAGRFLLIYFGYRYCPDVCPTELGKMAAALDLLPAAIQARIQPLFITVDPERDDPAGLKDYTALFHPALIGLTGTLAETRAAARAWRVFYAKQTAGRDADAYLMDHSSFIYLAGPDGRARHLFPPETTPEALAAALTRAVAGG
ncbi:MAG: SCO family protein [Roseococcus sp.]|nr:SCO family protein [Roseococcus sp.]